MRILLIEDDPMIGQSLCRALTDAGMTVDWERDGLNGQSAIESNAYTLVLLDLGLPHKSGFEVLKTIREQGKRTPLFIITARDDIDDRVMGLDLGADDYLIKPFSFKELLARINAVLRQPGCQPTPAVVGGEISLALAIQEATYRNKTVLLSAKEFALLQILTEHPGVIFSRRQLEERIYTWNEKIESNVIDVLIHQLRKKFDSEIIRNVRGIGWMIAKQP